MNVDGVPAIVFEVPTNQVCLYAGYVFPIVHRPGVTNIAGVPVAAVNRCGGGGGAACPPSS